MRRPYRTGLLGLLVAAGFVSTEGCSPAPPAVGSSTSDHTTGEPLSLNDPHVWIEASDADWAKGISQGDTEPAPRSDVTTVRLQQWIDRFHLLVGEMLVERGERLVAPKPTAALFKEYGPNAWVSSGRACPTGWTVRPERVLGGSLETPFLFIERDFAFGDYGNHCIDPMNWTDKGAFATFWNGQQHPCKLKVDENDELSLSGADCTVVGRRAPLVTFAVANTIGVTLDALSWGEEMRVAATLAHELGHYYRAHSNPLVKRHTDFFYREDMSGPDRPVAVEESRAYEAILADVRFSPRPVRVKAKTRYSKRLAGTLLRLRSSCPSAHITEAAARAIMGDQATSASSQQYVVYENAFMTCAQDGPLSDPGVKEDLDGALRWSRVRPMYSQSALTVDDALVELTAKFDEIDRKEAELVARMKTGNFGWYSDEQEADDMGLELMARAGFAPADVLAAELKTYEQLEEMQKRANVDRSDAVPMAQCKEWLAAGFTTTGADGEKIPVQVPVGTLSDPHHDDCYRLFNLWREAKRHDYVVGAPLPELTPAWPTIQARAIALGANPPPQLGAGNGPPTGGNDSDFDPEETAPPPRKRQPATSAAAPEAPVAPATMTVTHGGCATASAPTSGAGGAVLLALGVLVRGLRRRRPT